MTFAIDLSCIYPPRSFSAGVNSLLLDHSLSPLARLVGTGVDLWSVNFSGKHMHTCTHDAHTQFTDVCKRARKKIHPARIELATFSVLG